MDANLQRFWMLADRADWSAAGAEAGRVEYDDACRRLRLRDRRPPRTLPGVHSATGGDALLAVPARAIDAYGTVARWSAARNAVEASGGLGPGAEPVTLWTAPTDHRVTDLAMGFDDVLYLGVAVRDGSGRAYVGLFDPRGRWRQPPVHEVPLEDASADRLAADARGGVWVLDRSRRRVGRVRGLPLRDGLPPSFSPTTFRPEPEHADAPRFEPVRPPEWAENERPVDLACSPGGRLALLTWRPGAEAWLHLRIADGWAVPRRLGDPGEEEETLAPSRRSRPVAIAWLSERRLVVLPGPRVVSGGPASPREAIPYDPDDATGVLIPGGGFYPLRDLAAPVFLKGPVQPPCYVRSGDVPAPLRALSVVSFEEEGAADGRVLDGGRAGIVWHRLYLEAVFPPDCGADVLLAATDDPDAAELSWHPHVFGAPGGAGGDGAPAAGGARGVWVKDRSEVPHHAGLLDRDPEPGRAGLFTSLVQRPGRRVRRLAGRYLHVRVHLHGTGHRTPEIAALRAYAERFSYRDAYLPELYHEELVGRDADDGGAATGADFLDRFLALFESVLTPLEDRVAAAHAVMMAASAPPEALDWLGSWLGIVFDASFPEARRRAWIEVVPHLYRARGTLRGLQLALEIATGGRLRSRHVDGRERLVPEGGAVTSGEVVVLEDYRLRRTLATILGADLSEDRDPLLPGLIVSANSRVGDTLFVGEREGTELLTLFRDAFSDEPEVRAAEEDAVRAFYDRLAHRATVFVHESMTPVDQGLLERVAMQEAPAHVEVRVVRASRPLLVGLASLVDVDTYLGPRPDHGVVHAGRSHIGKGDRLRGTPALDPRLTGQGPTQTAPGDSPGAPPEARIVGPKTVTSGEALVLDGSRSTAAPGRVLERYVWTLRPPS